MKRTQGIEPPTSSTAKPDDPIAVLALRAVAETDHETPAARDGAAELLRPVLRQWLADNMPRIVERALHMELAEGIKGPGKKGDE